MCSPSGSLIISKTIFSIQSSTLGISQSIIVNVILVTAMDASGGGYRRALYDPHIPIFPVSDLLIWKVVVSVKPFKGSIGDEWENCIGDLLRQAAFGRFFVFFRLFV